jgi:hypothetical protein
MEELGKKSGSANFNPNDCFKRSGKVKGLVDLGH